MRRYVLLAGVAAVLLAFVVLRSMGDRRDDPAPRERVAASRGGLDSPARASDDRRGDDRPVTTRPRAGALADDAAPISGERDGPASLRGTEVDGGLLVDDAGRFIPNADARRFFDYFLAASGEESAERLRARIVAEIATRLSPEAAAAATVLLDRYLEYRERVRALAAESSDTGTLADRLAALRRIREEILGPTFAEALFADEEAVQRIDVERQRIATDETRSPEERARDMVALEERLPPHERESRAAATSALRLAHEEAELRARGGSAGELRALRESYFGVDAAVRLEKLDRTRQRWAGRVAEYRGARDAIEQDRSLSAGERAARTAALRHETFTPEERIRIEALERMERGAATEIAAD